MAHASDAFVRGATAGMDEPAGTVRLSVSEFVGVAVIPSILARLGERYPAIAIALELSNTSADLLDQEVDIAVRMFAPRQAALVARKVATLRVGFYANVDYLDRHGTPMSIADLADHRLIGPDRSRADLALTETIFPNLDRKAFVLRTDSHPAALAAARAGIGIAAVQRSVGDADPCLRAVVPDFDAATLDTWIVTHENLRNVARIRAVFDHLAEAFAVLGS
jgi:DNA-binding transcriptional LysR family regulator